MPSAVPREGDAPSLAAAGPIVYRVYANDGQGGPVDYSTPVAETTDPAWTSQPTAPGSHRFGVRAYDPRTGLEEANIDASAALIVDARGRDATHTPPAPVGLRAIPLSGGRVRLEWSSTASSPLRRSLTFNIYLNPGAIASYAVPAATTPAAAGAAGVFSFEMGGLDDGVRYAAAVRAANLAGEESNVSAVFFTADSSPPGRVDALLAASTSRSGA